VADSPEEVAVANLVVAAVDSPVAEAGAVVNPNTAAVGAAAETVAANRTAVAAATGDKRFLRFFFPQEGPAVNQITPPGLFFGVVL